MKLNRMAPILVLTVITVAHGNLLFAQDTPNPASQSEMMAEYMALAQPGPEHERLTALVGTWKMEITMWPAPGGEALTTSGKIINKMVLGGRFLMSESESGQGIMATQSIGIMGFDRRSGEYTSVGFDTWGTYYVTASGAWDEDRGAMVMSG